MAKSSFDGFSANEARRPRSTFNNVRVKLLMATTAVVLFSAIIWFIQTTNAAIARSREKQSLDVILRLHSSTALALLRTLQGILTVISSAALIAVFELILWCLSARTDGLRYVQVLILSSATGPVGTFQILCSPSAKLGDRVWAFLK